MMTFKDGEGVIHAMHRNKWGELTARTVCGFFDMVHRGDVYLVQRQLITCVACAAKPAHDVG
jgi:hypothetical protein